jgi:HEAT repeat protein
MTTLLAMALIAQAGAIDAGSGYSRATEAKYWLIGSAHGMWNGRKPGPIPSAQARTIVEERRRLRANVAVAMPNDLKQLFEVLTASDVQLAKLLLSTDPLLVKNAIAEASLRRSKAAVPNLRKLTEQDEFRWAATPTLATIGGKEAMQCLRGLLGHRDQLGGVMAAYGLAAHGLRGGIPRLWFGVRNPIVKSLRITQQTRRAASDALIRLGDVDTRPELDEVFRLTRADGRYLCPVLAKAGKPAQLAKLRDLLVDQKVDHLVRKWAATALGGIKDKAAAPNLKKALTDSSRHVREAAEAALSNLD